MKTVQLVYVVSFFASGVLSVPFTPYSPPGLGGDLQALSERSSGATLKLSRSVVDSDIHPIVARAQAVNRAYKKFSKRYLRVILG